ncbi:MAG: DUF3761 domain-containing protein [Acidobacteriota bacterium]|nr:DUF3761 domain-containing protein [Acidobacteriota bacterium]
MFLSDFANRSIRHAFLAAAVSAGACGGGVTPSPTSPAPASQEAAYTPHGPVGDGLAATAVSYKISGVVRDRNYPAWTISGASIAIAGGAAAKSNGSGAYGIKAVAGSRTLRATASGYSKAKATLRVKGPATQDFELTASVPSGASARCKDKTWSYSDNRSGTCSHHKGVAYWVCPGRLCR